MEKHVDRFLIELKEKFNKLGIKAVLFDLDDTLIYTSELFIKYKAEFVLKVSQETGIDSEVVSEHLEKIDGEEYKRMGVNPARWIEVVRRMTVENSAYGESAINNLTILQKIYTDEPRVKQGVKAILEILRMVGVKVALVTHANVEWTRRKLESTGLADYFDTITIADENRPKGAEDWIKTAEDVGVLPEECLILGDSLSGDIIPGDKIGAKTMWINTGSTWLMYKIGNPPDDTVHLAEVMKLLLALDELLTTSSSDEAQIS